MLSSDDIDRLMDEHVTKALGSPDDVTPALAARALAEELRDSNPELLVSWVDLHAEEFLATMIRSRIRAARSKSRTQVSAKRFSAAADSYKKTGDAQKFLSSFDVRYSINDSGQQRRVADMTGNDHKYVASKYEVTARRLRFLSSFHRAMSTRLGSQKVSDVFTEDQYNDMYRSIVGDEPERVHTSES